MLKIGTDIVYIKEFERRLANAREKFERDVFFEEELRSGTAEHLAGVFAAKEAAMKAFGIGAGKWKEIKLEYDESGKPNLVLTNKPCQNCDVSISHAGKYAIAVVAGDCRSCL